MKRLGKWSARGVGLVATVATVGVVVMLAPATASAQGMAEDTGFLPQEVIDKFGDCPPDSAFPDGVELGWCLAIRAYDGDLKLGDTAAEFAGPIGATVGIANSSSGPVIVPGGAGQDGNAQDGGKGAEVKVPGGLLGIPELDPILDPLGLLTVTATPQLGEVSGELGNILGLNDLALIRLPLSIKLNNLLFGPNCSIGTREDPFEVALTTGTTEPPPGVEPISGTTGEPQPSEVYFGLGGHAQIDERLSARSVDNAFAVPGANNCDTLAGLGFGDTPLASAVNLDSLVNSQVGLPAPAGQNHMKVSVDTATAGRNLVEAVRGNVVPEFVAWPLRFAEVTLGTSSTETLTVSNPRADSLTIPATADIGSFGGSAVDDFEVVTDGCAGQTLGEGETCEVEIRFTPTAEGHRAAYYARNPSNPFDQQRIALLRGIGTAP